MRYKTNGIRALIDIKHKSFLWGRIVLQLSISELYIIADRMITQNQVIGLVINFKCGHILPEN